MNAEQTAESEQSTETSPTLKSIETLIGDQLADQLLAVIKNAQEPATAAGYAAANLLAFAAAIAAAFSGRQVPTGEQLAVVSDSLARLVRSLPPIVQQNVDQADVDIAIDPRSVDRAEL